MILLHHLLLSYALALLPNFSTVFATPAKRQSLAVPDYVNTYAPVVWLESTDRYFPSDIAAQLVHTKPKKDFEDVETGPDPLTLENLNELNNPDGTSIYLTSIDDVTTNPAWLDGIKPDGSGKTVGGITCVVIISDHGGGLVDAFYMYFYANNWGGRILGSNVGNHVGDWEHTMVRFQDGQPQAVWFSQHAFGQAFKYQTVEKQGDRPVAYSANGSHANYAITGTHDHTIPGQNLPAGLLEDTTNQGTLWDPLLSAYYYSYDAASKAFTAYDSTHPTAFLKFVGRWGDKRYPDDDPRQHEIFGIDASARYVDGPTGPEDKQLNRQNVCPANDKIPCIVRTKLVP